jgi:hypothetical protein
MRSIYESESDESFFIDVETRESFVSVEELMGGRGVELLGGRGGG